MRRAPKAPVVEDSGPSKAWLDSYADAMTLLLAFFVLLYSFSLVDETKFAEFKFGVAQAFSFTSPGLPEGSSLLEDGAGVNQSAGQLAVMPSDVQSDIDNVLEELTEDHEITEDEVEELKEAIESALAAAAVDLRAFDVELDPRGVVITLDERLLFASGSARVNDDAAPALSAVAETLAEFDNPVLVEGHTDNVPTNGTSWATNWELSGARAIAVVRALEENYGIPGARLTPTGHAANDPRATNSTAEGRQQNRRTELVVLVGATSALESEVPFVADDDIAAVGIPGLDPTDTVDVGGFSNPVFTGP